MSEEHKAVMKKAREDKKKVREEADKKHLAEITTQIAKDNPDASDEVKQAKVDIILADEKLDVDILTTLQRYNTLIIKKTSSGKKIDVKEDPRIARALKALS